MGYLIEAFILGILYGLGPCTLICAPILIPLIISTSKNGKSGVIQTLTFYSGKILSYISLGLISGYAGYLFKGFITPRVIGSVLIALGLFVFLQRYSKKCQFLVKVKGKHLSFITGLVIGFRPCPALLALLSVAILTKSAFIGGLMGFIFGLGTLLSPLIILGFLAGKWAKLSEKFRGINIIICGLFLILLGIWKILL